MYLDCSLFIIVIKAIQPDCDKIKGISVLLLETPLTRSKYISPYTHAQHLTRTSRTFCTFAVTKTKPLQSVSQKDSRLRSGMVGIGHGLVGPYLVVCRTNVQISALRVGRLLFLHPVVKKVQIEGITVT